MPSAFLPKRAFITVGGPDAEDFLQNLITTDLSALPEQQARTGALLTPQGKILFYFLIWRGLDGFVLETDLDQQDALVRRLMLYRLRARVSIEPMSNQGTYVTWGDEAHDGIVDHRFEIASVALVRHIGSRDQSLERQGYDELRVTLGIVEAGEDFALQDAFPHDLMMDKSDGVSFRKGCYVGQEVVSRMQHRATARRRVVIVGANDQLPPSGTAITADGKAMGILGTVCGQSGLSILRIDKAGAAMAEGQTIMAGTVPVRLTLPQWSGLSFPTQAEDS